MLRHGPSDVDDYKIFPGRPLVASPQRFSFRDETRAGRVPERVSIPGHDAMDLATLLQENDTLAFLVIQGDALRYERYFNGHSRDGISLGFSTTKSMVALLVGCAIDDGLIGSVDDPITRYVPELHGRGFEAVTLRNLLMMTSGLDYAENDNPFGIHSYLYYCEDCLEREALQFELAEPPGTRYRYKSGDNLLLAMALRRALHGETLTAYLQRRVWNPLEMEHGGIWSTDGKLEKSWCCVSATARDFAKFGMLYLQGGAWRGQQIVSADWVKKATSVTEADGASWQYQFAWWHPFRDRSHYAMVGHLGQLVYVNPDTNVVVVRLGTSRGGFSMQQWWEILAAVSDHIGR
jgi:CubicO group peptidase (beta-lactamase class C family)